MPCHSHYQLLACLGFIPYCSQVHLMATLSIMSPEGAEGTLLTGPAAWSNKQADQPPAASTKDAQEGGSGARRARQEAGSKGQASMTGCQPRGSKACTCQEAPHMSTCVPV